jgi:pyruvate/2-oxoacid:ferredoxin oxidoreductase beta subunit
MNRVGFKQPNLDDARQAIGRSLVEIYSPYNDGWTQMTCKKDLYLLKCWLEDRYDKLPKFTGEEGWEKDRLIEILKK